ncbi:MAG: NTP transferase domain-containing protein [Armatimonadota bacterium]|nr:NTP transferase domain-containing protein [Armatimonadota bacterium]
MLVQDPSAERGSPRVTASEDMEKAAAPVGLILAAGRGTRFVRTGVPPRPKVLEPLQGKPLVCHVLETLREAGVKRVIVVVGFGAEQVESVLDSAVEYARQDVQLGSGHAVKCALASLPQPEGPVVVMCGDSPLFKTETIRAMLDEQRKTGAAVVLTSAVVEDPTGYGRIVRDEKGLAQRIVEEKCANAAERTIKEVNGGAYVFWGPWLASNIERMSKNDAGEYNLTDMIRLAVEQGKNVSVVRCEPDEILGVNTPDDLVRAEAVLRSRLRH